MENASLLDIEKKFLSYLFSDKAFIAKSLSKIKKEHLPHVSNIYFLIKEYYVKYKDIISDSAFEIQFSKRNVDENTIIYYKSLISNARNAQTLNNAEFEYIEDELLQQYKRSQLLNMTKHIITTNPKSCSDESLEKLILSIQKDFSNINCVEIDERKEGLIDVSADERLKDYEEIETNPESLHLIPTGFKAFDTANGGFNYGELVYIIGRKGDGKSVLMLNLAHNMWNMKYKVLLFSLEMDKKQYDRRFDSRAALISSKGLKLGKLTQDEKTRYKIYIDNLKHHKGLKGNDVGCFYSIDVPSKCTPSYVETKTEEIERKLDIVFDCVIVDYSQIMSPDIVTEVKRDNLGSIALSLKQFARNKQKLVITAAQMTRAGKNDTDQKNGHAGTEHVAESDQISDHIDWGIAIRSTSPDYGIIETFKSRDGAPVEFNFKKQFDKMNICELDDSEWRNIETDG